MMTGKSQNKSRTHSAKALDGQMSFFDIEAFKPKERVPSPGTWDDTIKVQDDKLHEYIDYYSTGEVYRRDFIMNKKYHHDTLPATTVYRLTGEVLIEKYFKHGEKHREDGPADIVYNLEGKMISSHYFLNGKEVESLDKPLNKITGKINKNRPISL